MSLGVRTQLQVYLRAVGAAVGKGLFLDHERYGIGQVVGCYGPALRGLEIVDVVGVGRQFELLAQLDDGVRRDGMDFVVEVTFLPERRLGRTVYAQER